MTKSPEAQVESFNRAFPLGSKALYRSHPTADGRATATRSNAWVLSGHTAVVLVEDVSGCVALSALVMLPNEPISGAGAQREIRDRRTT